MLNYYGTLYGTFATTAASSDTNFCVMTSCEPADYIASQQAYTAADYIASQQAYTANGLREARAHARVEFARDLERMEAADLCARKARALLLSHLTPGQRETFINHGWFIVEGGVSKKRYRMAGATYSNNIRELDANG